MHDRTHRGVCDVFTISFGPNYQPMVVEAILEHGSTHHYEYALLVVEIFRISIKLFNCLEKVFTRFKVEAQLSVATSKGMSQLSDLS